MTASLAERIATDTEAREYALNSLTPDEQANLLRDWGFWARPEQMEPADYGVWLIVTGRGWGKTRTGAETICDRIVAGKSMRIAFVGATAADVRDTMVDELRKDAGLLTVCERRGIRAEYQPSKRRVVFPDFPRVVVRCFTAEKPERLRGPQFDTIWFDEFAAFERTKIDAIWSNAMFGLRHGEAKVIITTTPKPMKKLRELIKMPTTHVTNGTTYDNMVNLSEEYKNRVVKPFEGTRLGRQELYGAILDDNPDALWTYEVIDRNRIQVDDLPLLERVVIAVDPAGDENGHEIGVVAAGRSRAVTHSAYDSRAQWPRKRFEDGDSHAFILGDYSLHGTPEQWADATLDAYILHQADAVVVERNYGGQMVASTVQNAAAKRKMVIHIEEVTASRGKIVRAEPISMLDAKNRVHHVGNSMTILEDQMVDFEQGGENDRVDARVWAVTELIARGEFELVTW